ncbi:hypothetical protein RJ640_029014 [Escallonia rubra]|uniref:Uncharacterized protein n=1 Tax=Escallonia rubra TaxID=112253 RepID=A0AA88S3L7_9ASTE|nr:hypothetical protein RJ640_029014 [Escallonia rubra]
MCPVQRERAAQTKVSRYTESSAGHRGPSGERITHSSIGDRCTNDNSKRHISAAYLPFRWHQRDPAKVNTFGCSTPLRSHELHFVAFPRAKRMGAVPWVSFGAGSEERPEE